MESQTYRTCIGCCTTLVEELIVEALYATPTIALLKDVAAMLNARGYKVTIRELFLELLY